MATITREQAQQAYQAWLKELNLTDEQKAQFHQAVDQAVAKANDMQAKGETVDPAAAKKALRSAVEKWLTPEQLVVWDRGFENAKAALGL
jgi:Spy/CpxP family protein refolding chaperone